jgi:hypothetical protein
LAASSVTFTQVVPQRVNPAAHAQAPAVHVAPPPQDVPSGALESPHCPATHTAVSQTAPAGHSAGDEHPVVVVVVVVVVVDVVLDVVLVELLVVEDDVVVELDVPPPMPPVSVPPVPVPPVPPVLVLVVLVPPVPKVRTVAVQAPAPATSASPKMKSGSFLMVTSRTELTRRSAPPEGDPGRPVAGDAHGLRQGGGARRAEVPPTGSELGYAPRPS